MPHHHGHHHHAPARYDRAFGWGIALNLGYIAIEVIAGFTVNSVALLADAGHNTSDVLSLVLAWGATWLARRPPTRRHTYGLRKTSVLASLTNAVVLLFAIGAIAWESVRRFAEPAPVTGGVVMAVAAVGVVINAATALLFMKGRHEDLNVKGAYLHMAADAGVSLGVVGAGLAINLTGAQWIDPVASLVIVVVIGIGTWGLLRDSFNLAMDAVPPGINPSDVHRYLEQQEGVTEVHDLHIWAMSTTSTALTAHVVRPSGRDDDGFLARLAEGLHERFGIGHPTIQVERTAGGCHGCEAHTDV